uniref:Uncharacterized protein At1g04910 n=1 Tax=Rhizophora mucronata TaxID=61149 RepID=A0A2P2JL28_RHIMU
MPLTTATPLPGRIGREKRNDRRKQESLQAMRLWKAVKQRLCERVLV